MNAIIEHYERTPFEWGTTDCCRFVCKCVQTATGRDLSAGMHWHDEASAKELIRSFGTLRDLVESQLGAPTDAPKDGDIALYQHNGEQILGVVDGRHCILRTKAGVTRWPRNRAVAIWSV